VPTIPKTLFLFSIKAILTVNSPVLFTNSFVPSSGSTSQKILWIGSFLL